MIVSEFGVCPPSASTKWRRSSVRDHTSVHASGRPWVAHGRPWSPIGTRECQGVPGGSGFNGRPWATRGDQGRPVAQLLGTRSSLYASSALQRSPAVAHGRPWSPIGTRECQGVPGGSGFNGRPWATRGDQGRPVAPLLGTRSSYASSARQRSPAVAHGRPWSPIGARGCQGVLASMGDHGRPGATRGDQWGPIE